MAIARRHDGNGRADEQLQPVHEVELRALAASKNVDLVAEDGVLLLAERL
jgi:hypothetical protein